MTLDEFLSAASAPPMAAFARSLGINPDQVRQWRRGTDGRQPSPQKCVQIEIATNGAVRRWDLRPEDWWAIWPELIGAEGAPPVPKKRAKVPA